MVELTPAKDSFALRLFSQITNICKTRVGNIFQNFKKKFIRKD